MVSLQERCTIRPFDNYLSVSLLKILMHCTLINELLCNNLQIYDRRNTMTCQLHFAILMKGKKPLTKWISNSIDFHAEQNVLRNFKQNKKNHNLSMLVVRTNKKGELRLSRPCTVCVNLLIKFGVNKVYYSDQNGHIIKQNVHCINHQFSGGYKHKYPKTSKCQRIHNLEYYAHN